MSAGKPPPQEPGFFDRVLTVYGRKPVLEILQNNDLQCHALHLATSNRNDRIMSEIRSLAQARSIPLREHSRRELSRISRNGKQDQGVALDVLCPGFESLDRYLHANAGATPRRLLALDGITNPQNLGMIIRSATAGLIDGIVLARRGNAALGPLVIKASAGTIFRAPLLSCPTLPAGLESCREAGATVFSLEGSAPQSLFGDSGGEFCVYVLGNESHGVSAEVSALCDRPVSIPMRNGVESLNVAAAASLIAYAPYFDR